MLYPSAKDMILRGEVNLLKDIILVFLSSDSFNNNNKLVDDVTVSSNTQLLKNIVIDRGVFDASDVIFGGIVTGTVIKSAIISTEDGKLIACIENINGFPFTSTMDSIFLKWNDNTNKILSI